MLCKSQVQKVSRVEAQVPRRDKIPSWVLGPDNSECVSFLKNIIVTNIYYLTRLLYKSRVTSCCVASMIVGFSLVVA